MSPLILKSTQHLQLNKIVIEKAEHPLFTFNRLCYAFLNNDFIMVGSSIFTLLVSITVMAFSQIRHLNINQ